MKFQQLMITETRQMKTFLAFKLPDVVFVMLINVKMLSIVDNFNIYEQDKFRAQLSWAWKFFITLGPGLGTVKHL